MNPSILAEPGWGSSHQCGAVSEERGPGDSLRRRSGSVAASAASVPYPRRRDQGGLHHDTVGTFICTDYISPLPWRLSRCRRFSPNLVGCSRDEAQVLLVEIQRIRSSSGSWPVRSFCAGSWSLGLQLMIDLVRQAHVELNRTAGTDVRLFFS